MAAATQITTGRAGLRRLPASQSTALTRRLWATCGPVRRAATRFRKCLIFAKALLRLRQKSLTLCSARLALTVVFAA